jgi:hypothetical protein
MNLQGKRADAPAVVFCPANLVIPVAVQKDWRTFAGN